MHPSVISYLVYSSCTQAKFISNNICCKALGIKITNLAIPLIYTRKARRNAILFTHIMNRWLRNSQVFCNCYISNKHILKLNKLFLRYS